MKVLQIINSLATGGAEKLIIETLPLYRGKGIEMDLLVLNGKDCPFMEELKHMDCCTVYSLGLKSVYNPLNIFKIIPYLKKYDIIHVHLFPSQYWVVLAKLLSFSKTKLVFTEHSTSNRRIQNAFLKYVDRFFYKKYHQIICITEEVLEVLKKHTLLPLHKFEVIKNGVAIEKFKIAETISKNEFFKEADETVKILIQVSSFQVPKDQITLIKSLQFLPENIKLLLVGDGVLRKDCQDFVLKNNLQDRVLFLGLRMDVPRLLKTADVVVLSSKYEGLSLSSIEGMAAGKPFVASDVPGLSDVVKDAGILFELGNSEELAKIILKLLHNKNYYDLVAKTCQVRAALYDIKIMVDKHIVLYERILKK